MISMLACHDQIKEGAIVPVVITVKLIKRAMEQRITAGSTSVFLIDGFPRNQENLEGMMIHLVYMQFSWNVLFVPSDCFVFSSFFGVLLFA